MDSNRVRESCKAVLDALTEYDGPVEGLTLSDISNLLGLTQKMRGKNFSNAIKELLRHHYINRRYEMREIDGREERVMILSLVQ
ncbi:MAG TPA: hypothetical protein VFT59_02285 [Candidatus Saccharimonadales bacterium]|nr:hypothetical protein [Candidatus Saccharimonadales bacterium]